MNTKPLEAYTRHLVDTNLINLDWKFKGKYQNVYLEQPRTEAEKKKLGGKRPDYILYSQDKNIKHPLIIIETKKTGKRLDSALEQGILYARILEAPLVFATDGVFCKSYHTLRNTTPKLNGEDVDELLREVTALKFLEEWEVNTVSKTVQSNRDQLIKIFDEANNMLRGDGLRAGIERFSEFANILFLKLISETKDKDICHWDNIKNQKIMDRIAYINGIVYKRLNELYGEIFTPLTMRNNEILSEIMDELDPLTLIDVDSDVKGDAFEYFLKKSTSTENDLGEYFTPRHIVKTMVRLINPQITEKIYDPFCGTGGFLIESFRYIHNNMFRSKANMKILNEETLYGNEITNTARIAKMNMILAGDGHTNINMKDSLEEIVDGKYNIVITNMPYSQKTKHGNLYELPSTNGDSICVQHCIKAISGLSDNGRMALVVPEGFLFRKDLSKVREYLLERCELRSIISLPQGVFLPYTGVKTNIIYATKVNHELKPEEKRKDYWYFSVKSDGLSLDNHRRKLNTSSDLIKFEEYRAELDDTDTNKKTREKMLQEGFEIIPFDKVRENTFILIGNRYRERVSIIDSKWDMLKLGEIAQIIRGVTYSENDQTLNKTDKIILTADNITLDGFLKIKKQVYLDNNFEISEDKKLKANDIFICFSSGSKKHLGKVAFIETNTNYYAGGFMGIIRTFKNYNSKYIYLLLNTLLRQSVRDIGSGSNINNLSSIINDMPIPLPPLEIQRQIVDELEGYQGVIDGAKKILQSYKPAIPKNIKGETKILSDIATFKPSKDEVKTFTDDTLVSFVPMADLNAHNISFVAKEEKPIKEIINGFTYFKDNDILLAKITPCFENGKAGIARNLKNGIGFGSTEYIVIRANTDIVYPEWIYYHINSSEFLLQGKNYMTGTAGQQRVDITFVEGYSIIVPTLSEQRHILDNIEFEQALIKPSKQLIEVFTKKIQDRINEIIG